MNQRQIRVLLIEDNPGDARLVREALASVRMIDFAVEATDRLAAGIERLRRFDPDVVLLDLSLPDSEGFAGVDQIARAAPQIPIVALSGLSNAEVIQDAVKKGAEDYIVKGS
ncbi:MAG TPA: response regulator, partial [Candidatus Binataceae bacterium]|nr:response regulator [Candidatus Binataceae bacterium]